METIGKVISVNISKEKGVIKSPVNNIELIKTGIKNDAHAGDWHRQISLLADESITRFKDVRGRDIDYGEFAENITTKGLVLFEMKPGDIIKIGKEVVMQVTQIGKKCHGDGCAIFTAAGRCVMPKEGIFCKVITNGNIKADDDIIYLPLNTAELQ